MPLARKTPDNVTLRLPLLTGSLVGLCVIAYLLAPVTAWAVYERAGITQGEWWRLFTAHLVHFSPAHLAFNLLGLVMAAGLVEMQDRRQMCQLSTLMILVICPTLFLLHPDMAWYGGMSGLVYGYAFYCALLFNKTQPSLKWLSRLVLALIPLKIMVDSLNIGLSVSSVAGSELHNMSTSHALGVTAAFLFYLHVLRSGRPLTADGTTPQSTRRR